MGISERRAALTRDRQPHVVATVVRTEQPTSAHPGDQAIVLPDGRIEGFVGGQCTETSVTVAAVRALQDGEPVLLRVLPEGAPAFPDVPGASVAVNPCLSGGAVEIFLEPVLPAPMVHIAGDSPIAGAVAELCGMLGYDVVLAAAGGEAVDKPDAVVIARHGGPEAGEIRAALDAGAAYVGLVASPRRGAAVLEEAAIEESERARVFAPAGHWIGAESPGEVAVSILAEVIEVLRLRRAQPAAESAPRAEPELLTIGRGPVPTPEIAVDPICGMSVVVGPDAIQLRIADDVHYFCCAGCRDAFAQQQHVTTSH